MMWSFNKIFIFVSCQEKPSGGCLIFLIFSPPCRLGISDSILLVDSLHWVCMSWGYLQGQGYCNVTCQPGPGQSWILTLFPRGNFGGNFPFLAVQRGLKCSNHKTQANKSVLRKNFYIMIFKRKSIKNMEKNQVLCHFHPFSGLT